MNRILSNPAFHATLCAIDFELAEATRLRGCRYCGGKLHSARYPRKPRCGRELTSSDWSWRWSFCCSREGCRRRTTPPSVRFLGRRVWPGIIIVVLSAIDQLLGRRRAKRFRQAFGVARRTLDRWRSWWQKGFPRLELWRFERARFGPPPPSQEELPAALVTCFGPRAESSTLTSVLRFLSPISTSIPLLEQASFSRGQENPQNLPAPS